MVISERLVIDLPSDAQDMRHIRNRTQLYWELNRMNLDFQLGCSNGKLYDIFYEIMQIGVPEILSEIKCILNFLKILLVRELVVTTE